MHNLGVVLWEGAYHHQYAGPVLSVPVEASLPVSDTERELFVNLLAICVRHSAWDFGLMYHHSMVQRGLNKPVLPEKVHFRSHSDISILLGTLRTARIFTTITTIMPWS